MHYLVAPERIETATFTLRSYVETDGPHLRDATNSSFDHLAPWMPWAVRDQTDAEAEELVRRFRARYLLAEDFILGIFAPGEQQLLGGAGFHLREGALDSLNAECGMWIRAESAGQGLGGKVLIALLAWGFSAWPWQRITWRCDGRNVASQRVAERAGMQREGVLRGHTLDVSDQRQDTIAYAALRNEWRAPAD